MKYKSVYRDRGKFMNFLLFKKNLPYTTHSNTMTMTRQRTRLTKNLLFKSHNTKNYLAMQPLSVINGHNISILNVEKMN